SAIDDITVIEQLNAASALSTQFYRLPEDGEDVLRLKIYHLGTGLPLSDVVPKLENLGLRVVGEHPHTVRRASNADVSVQDYELSFPVQLDLQKAGVDFNDAFVRIWRSEVEDDRFNRLILHAGLSWREVTVLRAYAQYMKQIRFGFSQFAISDALFQHQTIARDLVLYFIARFDPDATRTDACPEIRARILTGLEDVALLNEDRVLRRFLELMDASMRTNYFVQDGDGMERSCLAIKLAPGRISGMPQPVPQHEVFVSAPHLEGVHLRSGPISRGGLRWSDRREDFRTEVLGLVKAQVVKNAVIVPTGAKGGFVVKGEHTGESCYRDFIRSLLDITDNIVDGLVTAPAGVRAHDEQDPYLVVAADKGTATFSDIANEIAEQYQFWLGDAFASGGSFGYDHKKMGITARGAWVSVQRHFAEIGVDVQNEEFTVLGIGDMGGDVFGNGMLLSPCIQLVAAFNHQHIFIDPQPEAAAGFAERQRLFALPRSGWGDYDASLISAGGGIFPRSAKAIEITPQMQSRFAIDAESLAPDDLIHHLLKSPVQLIWNGGIGTYVKATGESHDEVGDRANDHLRVNAAELQCAVFGEGGNLGVTQKGRIEFNLAGGAINTDAIDNSAGVDCSDHEVNIKIALGELVAREDMTRKQRNQLLESMTDSVADLVLQNNYNQARTISLTQQHSITRGAQYARLIGYLCEHAGLDPLQENLPGDDELADRYAAGHSLTRPEIAVLLAYAKSHIKNELMASNVSAEALIRARLHGAFPAVLVDDHAPALERHRLAAEIIATQLANEMVDCMGSAFVAEMVESGSHTVADVARAYVVVSACFGFADWFADVREQGGAAATQLEILQEVVRLGRRATRWMLRHTNLNEPLEQVVQRFKPVIAEMQGHRNGSVGEKGAAWTATKDALLQAGVAPALAHKSAHAAELARLLPVVDVARQRDCPVDSLVDVTTAIGHELQIDWLSYQLAQHAADSHWQSVERESLLDDLFTVQNLLGALVLKSAGGDVSTWLASNELLLQGWYAALRDLTHGGAVDFTVYSILARKLSDLGARLQSA
ncbi:MAG: NAD-glutamate dehydrogenase domain-containing protein, partial [Pseudomonadota bacterium]